MLKVRWVFTGMWMLVSRSFNSRFDSMIKGFWKCPKYREDLQFDEIEWELNSDHLICGRHILSGRYVSLLLLYVADIFEWELGNITICGDIL